MTVRLSVSEWTARQRAHEDRVRPWITPRLERSFRHERHPVEDFLFEYYSFRPSQLLRWHPGFGVLLEDGVEFLARRGYERLDGGVGVAALPAERVASTQWIHDLLVATGSRAGNFGCHGLHEWAMVYRSDDVRHAAWPLRLTPHEIARVVECQPVRCSHFDAFRFFTPSARPLNRLQPTRESALDFEQPACLHANMDLYKWAYKLVPFTPSELLTDAFSLAREIRTLDMRASPYDFSELGCTPVAIETPAGRAEYEESQRGFAHRARAIRERLIGVCRTALASVRQPANALAALAVSFFLSSCATVPLPENAEPLVDLMAERLDVARDVAWAKWAEGLPVRDPARERKLLERISAQAEMAGLEGLAAARFMRAQIEGSCLQQEYWMQKWRTGHGLPPGEPPTLDALRSRLDSLSARLIAEWAAMAETPMAPASVRDALIQRGITPAAATAASAGVTARPTQTF